MKTLLLLLLASSTALAQNPVLDANDLATTYGQRLKVITDQADPAGPACPLQAIKELDAMTTVPQRLRFKAGVWRLMLKTKAKDIDGATSELVKLQDAPADLEEPIEYCRLQLLGEQPGKENAFLSRWPAFVQAHPGVPAGNRLEAWHRYLDVLWRQRDIAAQKAALAAGGPLDRAVTPHDENNLKPPMEVDGRRARLALQEKGQAAYEAAMNAMKAEYTGKGGPSGIGGIECESYVWSDMVEAYYTGQRKLFRAKYDHLLASDVPAWVQTRFLYYDAMCDILDANQTGDSTLSATLRARGKARLADYVNLTRDAPANGSLQYLRINALMELSRWGEAATAADGFLAAYPDKGGLRDGVVRRLDECRKKNGAVHERSIE